MLFQIWLGGTPNQTSLAECFMDKVKVQNLEKVFEPLFYNWKTKRLQAESFGSFTIRTVSTKFIPSSPSSKGKIAILISLFFFFF